MAEIRFERATRVFRGADAPAVDRLDPRAGEAHMFDLVTGERLGS